MRRCRALPATEAVQTSSHSVIQMPGGSAAASACAPARSVDSATAATDARRWGMVTTVLRHQRLLQAEALEDEVSTSARQLVARITLLYDSAARLSNAGAPLLERSQAPPSAMPSAASQRQLAHLSHIKQVQPVDSCSSDRPTAYQIRLVPSGAVTLCLRHSLQQARRAQVANSFSDARISPRNLACLPGHPVWY